MGIIKISFTDDRGVGDVGGEGTPSQVSTRYFEPLVTIYRRVWRPAVDISERENFYTVVVELAGVRSDDLHVEISNRTVRIYGIRTERIRQNAMRYHLAEITYGYFERVLTLPVPIDRDNVEAVFSEGLLEIRIPKAAAKTAIRRIPITREG